MGMRETCPTPDALHSCLLLLPWTAGFGVLRGSFTSALAAWLVSPAMLFLVGATVPLVGLPCTRMYSQLERVSGYSFGYNLAMGVIGGETPHCGCVQSAAKELAAVLRMQGGLPAPPS